MPEVTPPEKHRYRMTFHHVDVDDKERTFPSSYHTCDVSEPIWPSPPSPETLLSAPWIEINDDLALGYYTPSCCFPLPFRDHEAEVKGVSPLLNNNDEDDDDDDDLKTTRRVKFLGSNNTTIPEERAFVYANEVIAFLLYYTRELVERAGFGGGAENGNKKKYSLFLSSARIVWAEPAPLVVEMANYSNSNVKRGEVAKTEHSCAVTLEHLRLVRARGHIDYIHVEFRLTKKYTKNIWGKLEKGLDNLSLRRASELIL